MTVSQERPHPFDIEQLFNEFVTQYDGALVSELIPKGPQAPNADYFFDKANVVAELKCLQKDLFNTEEDIPRLFDFFAKWKDKGLICEGDLIKYTLGTKQLPAKCRQDLMASASKTIERGIHHAAKQIAQTKIDLQVPQAHGLLLLANDGNYFLSNAAIIAIVCNLLSRKFSSSAIDGFVYFTVNQNSFLPGSDLDWHIWSPVYRDENNIALGDFVNALGADFINRFLSEKSGIPVTEHLKIDDVEKGLGIIKNSVYVPRNEVFRKKK